MPTSNRYSRSYRDRSHRDRRKFVRFIVFLCSALIIDIAIIYIGFGQIAPGFQTRTISAAAISPTGVQDKILSDPGTIPHLFPNIPQVITPTCGIVMALTKPGGSTAGSINIEGTAYAIPPGTPIDPSVAVCTNACVAVDPFGQVLAVTYNAPSNFSGTVTAYNPGTSIAINGTTYPIAASANIDAGVHVGDQVTVAMNSAGAAACIRHNSPGGGGVQSRMYLPSVLKQH